MNLSGEDSRRTEQRDQVHKQNKTVKLCEDAEQSTKSVQVGGTGYR